MPELKDLPERFHSEIFFFFFFCLYLLFWSECFLRIGLIAKKIFRAEEVAFST